LQILALGKEDMQGNFTPVKQMGVGCCGCHNVSLPLHHTSLQVHLRKTLLGAWSSIAGRQAIS